MATLAEFYQAKKDNYSSLQTAAKNNLSTTMQNVKVKQDKYDATYDELAEILGDINELRIAMSKALMPVDVETLATQFRNKQAALRKKNVELLADQLALDTEKRRQELYSDEIKRIESELYLIEEQLDEAKQREALHVKWENIFDSDDFKDFKDLAQDLLDKKDNSDPANEHDNVEVIRAALDRIEADIPQSLRVRAEERHGQVNTSIDVWKSMLASLKDKYGDFHDNNMGPQGTVEDLWIDFIQAENKLKEFARMCLSAYDQAVSFFKSIVASADLTTSEHDRIHDGDLENDALTALAQEKVRDVAQAAVDSAYVAHQVAIANAIATSPLANPDNDSAVIPALNDYNDAVDDLAAEEAAFTQQMKDNLDLWEASIPNHIWQNQIAYEQGISLLTTLTTTVPGNLLNAMKAAELALTAELDNENKLTKVKHDLEDTITLVQGKIKYYQDSRQARVLSAVRGDN